MLRYFTFPVLFCLLVVAPVHAIEDAEAEKNIRQVLSQVIPDEPVTRIRPTPIDNLYLVLMGPNVVYMTGDGRYVFKGDMLDMQARENISEIERANARKRIFAGMSNRDYIEFSNKDTEHLLYVFTDIDCGYCRRLHRDVAELNDNGIGIRYLAYPRGGTESDTYELMQSVWCADNPQQALTDAKNGKNIESKQCDNPVEEEYMLGRKFGVRGTPALYTADGEELSGYIPPRQLIEVIKGR